MFPLWIFLLSMVVPNDGVLVLKPIHQVVHVETQEALTNWDYKFNSSQGLAASVKQGGFVQLADGQEGGLMYAVFHKDAQLFVVVLPKEGGRFDRATLQIGNNDANFKEYSNIKLIPLVTTDVLGPTTKNISYQKMNVGLFAYTVPITVESTPVKIKYKGWKGPESSSAFETVVSW